jgi:cytochrome c
MPAHPQLTDEQAALMVGYILSLSNRKTSGPSLPVRGAYDPPAGSGDSPTGAVVLRAEYTDRGAKGMPAINTEKEIVLRSPTMVVATGQLSEGVSQQSVPELPVPVTVVNRPGSSVAFKQIDLTGIGGVTLVGVAPAQYQANGGKVEVHLDSPTGPSIGDTEPIKPTTDPAAPPTRLRVALKPTTGVHDVYLVFTNPDMKADGFMFGLLTATFEPAR